MVHLIGPPGVGKYTIGSAVARALGARLVDNHSITNVIFNLVAPDGVAPISDAVWSRVSEVRAVVIDTLMNVAPGHLSYVFTNVLRGNEPADEAIYEEFRAVAEVRGSVFVPVGLSCATPELQRRAVGEDRRARMKLIDPEAVGRFNDLTAPFRASHPNWLSLDVTETAPGEAAGRILAWVQSRLAPP